MGAAHRFKQADLERAIKGAQKAGMRVGRVEIRPTGEIVILTPSEAPKERGNSWDDV